MRSQPVHANYSRGLGKNRERTQKYRSEVYVGITCEVTLQKYVWRCRTQKSLRHVNTRSLLRSSDHYQRHTTAASRFLLPSTISIRPSFFSPSFSAFSFSTAHTALFPCWNPTTARRATSGPSQIWLLLAARESSGETGSWSLTNEKNKLHYSHRICFEHNAICTLRPIKWEKNSLYSCKYGSWESIYMYCSFRDLSF